MARSTCRCAVNAALFMFWVVIGFGFYQVLWHWLFGLEVEPSYYPAMQSIKLTTELLAALLILVWLLRYGKKRFGQLNILLALPIATVVVLIFKTLV